MADLITQSIINRVKSLIKEINGLQTTEKIECINSIKILLHDISPFRDEPVDCVIWVKTDEVEGNDYNPNTVAPPEMKLLELSITADGYTQPVVTNKEDNLYRVIDGFHRNRIARESKKIKQKLQGYLPIVQIRNSQTEKEQRMASTIRHNRARGKHGVEPMTGIVSYLSKKGWDDEKVAKELGMEADEVLRFKQISGLTELFQDKEFSLAWEV